MGQKIIPYLLLSILLGLGACRHDADGALPEPQTENFARSIHLYSVEEVVAALATPHPPLLVEISKAEKFAQGHLPGAVHLWRPDYEDAQHYPYGGMRASREQVAALLGSLGAKQDELIIVYCTKGSADAARFTWILRGYGHERVVMMDGGKAAWQHAGHPLTKASGPRRASTDYAFPAAEKPDYSASLEEVLAAIADTNTLVVDTREDYEYLGIPHVVSNAVVRYKKGAFAPGAIPTARHLNWSEAVDLHADHTFKSLADLKYNFLREGISPDKRIIVYCQSGVRSAHTAFVLQDLLGYPNVKNYDGSWIEWSFFHAKDTTGKIEHHVGRDEVETIYTDLVASLSAVDTK